MFVKALTTALVSATLLAGTLQTPAFADMGGGGGGGFSETHTLHFNMPKKQNRPWASSTDPRTGHTTTSRGASDGARHITVTDRNGNVIHTDRMDPRKKADGKKNKKAAKKPGRPWASAYDPATGTRTTSVGLNQRGSLRAVISVGPFGIGFGYSR
jgi:hypothetical protein